LEAPRLTLLVARGRAAIPLCRSPAVIRGAGKEKGNVRSALTDSGSEGKLHSFARDQGRRKLEARGALHLVELRVGVLGMVVEKDQRFHRGASRNVDRGVPRAV